MTNNSLFRRAMSALTVLMLVVGMAFSQNIVLNGTGGTLNGTYNIKGNINNAGAGGVYTFSGTVNLNRTAVGTQDIGGAAGPALVFATLNSDGSRNKNQVVTVTVNTAFDIDGGNTYAVGANTLNFGGTTSVTSGSFNASNASSTVNYTSGSAQTVLATTYGGTLGLSGAGAKDLGGAVTAAVVSHTASSGALTVDENLTIDGGSASSLDAISVTASDILDVTGTGGLTIANVTANAGTIRKTTAAGTITFSQASLSSAGTISASAGTLTFDGDVSNSGSLTLSGTGTANFAQDLTNSGTLTFNASGTSVNYTGTVAQSVASATYYTLAMSGGGTKTAAGNVTIAAGGSFNNGTATTDMDTYNLDGTGSKTQAAGGTMLFGGAANGVVFANGTVNYNGGDGVTQAIAAGTYETLVLSRKSGAGTAAKEIADATTVTTTGSMTVPNTTSLALLGAASVLTVEGDLTVEGAITNAGTVNVGAP